MTKRDREDLRMHQLKGVSFIKENPGAMLSLAMGCGKTAITLTAVRDLIDSGQVANVLVIAPLLVAEETWPEEIETWTHTEVLTYEVLTGPPKRREQRALRLPEVSIINTENLVWLIDFWGDDWPYDMVVVDEISRFKTPRRKTKPSKRAVQKVIDETIASLPEGSSPAVVESAVQNALRKQGRNPTRFGALCTRLKQIDRIVGLTGTIAPNGLLDIWSQYYLLDQGKRLGGTFNQYRNRYFDSDYMGYKFTLREGAFEHIVNKISDLTISMKTEDYVDMPPVCYNEIRVKLPPKVMEKYREFEETLFYEEHDIEAINNGVLINKLLQASNGSLYLEDGSTVHIHDAKIQALDSVIEEANGAPVLVAYSYQFDLERLRKKYPQAEVVGEAPNLQKRWNAGEIPILLAHPACLHPRTEVLTEFRGWVRIIDVREDERVFDGVEFVSHKGCSFSGIKPVIEVEGITLTPNHKLLVDGVWLEAKDVRSDPSFRGKAVYAYEGDDPYLSKMLPLSKGERHSETELRPSKPGSSEALRGMSRGGFSPDDKYSFLEHLAVGYECCAAGEQIKQSTVNVHGEADAPRRVLSSGERFTGCDNAEIKQRNDAGASARRLSFVEVPEESQVSEVYDLVDCGPRNRFLIRNDDGDVFISHNSAGHGLNLQYGGCITVWYGLNWSLELYQQLNKRLHRPGQKNTVFIHHIISEGTVDERIMEVLPQKDATQDALIEATKWVKE